MKTLLFALLSLGLLPLCLAQLQKPGIPTVALKLTPEQKKRLLELRKPILKRQFELDQEKRQLVSSLSSAKESQKRDTLYKRLTANEKEYTTLSKKSKQAQDSVLTKEQQALVKQLIQQEHKK